MTYLFVIVVDDLCICVTPGVLEENVVQLCSIWIMCSLHLDLETSTSTFKLFIFCALSPANINVALAPTYCTYDNERAKMYNFEIAYCIIFPFK